MLGGVGGFTAIDATGDVVRVVDPLTFPDEAVIVVEPAVRVDVARPKALTVATVVFDEPQVTELVISRARLSENVPTAASCTGVPGAMLGFIGVTKIERRVGGG